MPKIFIKTAYRRCFEPFKGKIIPCVTKTDDIPRFKINEDSNT